MRIWSKDLIITGSLPKKQLMAMRYELGDMIKQYPNIKNGLVKFANRYDVAILYGYYKSVLKEFDRRGIRHNDIYDNGVYELVVKKTNWLDYWLATCEEYRFDDDDTTYLSICLTNLYEKKLRDMINDEEWDKILRVFPEYII